MERESIEQMIKDNGHSRSSPNSTPTSTPMPMPPTSASLTTQSNSNQSNNLFNFNSHKLLDAVSFPNERILLRRLSLE
jgi:hypothetical protein